MYKIIFLSLIIGSMNLCANDVIQCTKNPATGIVECEDGSIVKLNKPENKPAKTYTTCWGEGNKQIPCQKSIPGEKASIDIESIKAELRPKKIGKPEEEEHQD